ncbi:hypothetical protein FTV88_0632 [Heliorestis convoluta]|uniref:Uncharacterized protein n=1 Tax=Heliorestis convoluta TaxID=356322 RepID=A0A5Q2MY33_9FIRM|nr:hypothetical protein FTV88_0632 [Heliorestis convoluta]
MYPFISIVHPVVSLLRIFALIEYDEKDFLRLYDFLVGLAKNAL